MSEEDSFLDAVRAAPDDDAPRLIYADWLEERGGERRTRLAEFIRVQIAVGAAAPYTRERDALEARELELSEHVRAALQDRFAALGVRLLEFRRGLPATVWFEGVRPISSLDELTRVAPGLSGVRLTDLNQLWKEPWLQRPPPFRVTELAVFGNESDFNASNLESLARSPWLADVEHLTIKPYGAYGRGAEQRWSELAPILHATSRRRNRRLRSLRLPNCWADWTPAIGREIAALPIFDQIESLDLSDNAFDDDLPSFLAACRLPALRELNLSGARYVRRATLPVPPDVLKSLARLDLSRQFRPRLLTALAASREHLTSLVDLNLAENFLPSDGLQALPADFRIDSLARLRLDFNSLGDAGATTLAEMALGSTICELGLNSNDLTDVGARALAASPNLSQLHFLEVVVNHLTPTGRRLLRTSPRLGNLMRINA